MKKVHTNGLWPSRLLDRIEGASVTRSYPEAAKYVRNQLRPYSATSVIQIAWNRLNAGDYHSIEHLQTWPWLSCLIVKLVLEDEDIRFEGGMCPDYVFNRCLNALWEAQAGRDNFGSGWNIWLKIRAILTAQMAFQRRPRWDFLRFPALIDRLEFDHPSRTQFVERFGMEPHAFMCISYAILAGVASGKKSLDSTYYGQLTTYFGDAVARVFDEFSRDLRSLRTQLVAEKCQRRAAGKPLRPAYEYNEEPWLQRFPLLRLGSNEFLVWHPAVFARGLETAVHRRMSVRAAEYSNSFSKVFEAYVLELLKASGTTFVGEDEYKQLVGRDKKSVEAIISQDGVNILIEAKLTAYSEIVNISSDAGRVWVGMKRIYEAMRQGWVVSTTLQGKIADKGSWCQTTENYLLIVTSQPMACASGEHFRRLFGRDVFDVERLRGEKQTVPNPAQLQMLPPAHIVIASIDEYEYLIDAAQRGDLHLPTMFRKIAAQIASPENSFTYLEQFLEMNYRRAEGAPVVMSTLGSLHETLAKCFDVDASEFDVTQ